MDGRVTSSAQSISEPDLMYFEGMPVPNDIETCLTGLIEGIGLNGQIAFDYMREADTG